MEKKTLEQLLEEVPMIVDEVRSKNFDDAKSQTIDDLLNWADHNHDNDLSDDEKAILSDALDTAYCNRYDD